MKIEQLLQREPFGEIIERTLTAFFAEYFGDRYHVAWRPIRLAERLATWASPADGTTYFCNPYLNILMPERFDASVGEFVRSNYGYTPFRSRRYLQYLYVEAAVSPIAFRVLATHVLEVTPALPESSALVILGGNNRLRLIDLRLGRTWDLLKSGFCQDFIRSELEARLVDGDWPFPRVRAIGPSGTWFESDFISAVSVNRLRTRHDDPHLLAQAFDFLAAWLDRTRSTISVESYVTTLQSRIDGAYYGVARLAPVRTVVASCFDIATRVLEVLGADRLTIEVASGHGDFQEGNILVDERHRVWIVDWEHSGVRLLAYDYLVFALRSRFPAGLAARVIAGAEDSVLLMSDVHGACEAVNLALASTSSRSVILILFLLEELLWHVSENANPNFTRLSGALPQLIAEVVPALEALEARVVRRAEGRKACP